MHRRLFVVTVTIVVGLAYATPAHALTPGSVFAASGQPGTNTFLPGRANVSGVQLADDAGWGIGTQAHRTVSAGGVQVVFVSRGDALSDIDDDLSENVYLHDRATGATELISRAAPGGSQAGDSNSPVVSDDGQVVAFVSEARLTPADGDDDLDVYVRDRAAGTTTLVSEVPGSGLDGVGINNEADISGDGDVVVWTSTVANTFSAADTSTEASVYALDRDTNALTLVSRAPTAGGASANGASDSPAVDEDGSRIAFITRATNIDGGLDPDPAADNRDDVYVRVAGTQTFLASRASGLAGVKSDGSAFTVAISPDGEHVAFNGLSTNLGDGDNGNVHVHVRRNFDGDVAPTTTVASRQTGPAGTVGDSSSGGPLFDNAGALVFTSFADNLVPGIDDETTHYRRELGGAQATTALGRRDGPTGAVVDTYGPASVSADGSAVAFGARDAELAPDDDNAFYGVYVRIADVNHWVSRPSSGVAWRGGATTATFGQTTGSVLTPDGRYLLFGTAASAHLPAGADTGAMHLMRRDNLTGTLTLVDRYDGPDGAPSTRGAYAGQISDDGRYVLFTSREELTGPLPGELERAFLRDLVAGTTTLVSVATDGTPADDDVHGPALSGDGRRVAFTSAADNLGAGPVAQYQAFLRDVAAGTTTLVSAEPDGDPAAFAVYDPAVDGDGSHVVFNTSADGLDPADADGKSDVLVRDVAAATTRLVSLAADGTNKSDDISHGDISADGTKVAFSANAKDLVPEDTDDGADAYVRDLVAGTTVLVSVGDGAIGNTPRSVNNVTIAAGGRHVAFTIDDGMTAADTDGQEDLVVRDLAAGRTSIASQGQGGIELGGAIPNGQISGDAGCAIFSLLGPDDGSYGHGPTPSPGIPGTAPAPEFGVVLLRVIAPTCLPDAPSPPGAPGAPAGPATDGTAPVISRLAMSNRRFARTSRPTAVSAQRRRRVPRGTAFRLTLSEAATVTFTIERRTTGRRVGRTCRKATARLRKRRRCIRYERRGVLRRKLTAGRKSVAFSGRIGRKALPRGTFRATVRAVDAAGNRSAPRRVTFTIVR